MNRPKALIGIVPDYREGGKADYSVRPYYALRRNYVDGISQAGGSSVILTYDYDLIDFYLENLDGIMIVGGYFDINPKRYDVGEVHHSVKLNEVRENFEYEIMSRALKGGKMPIFGICNGMQLINVLHQGKIIQHIPDEENFMDHEQSHHPDFTDYHKAYHDVLIEKNSRLFNILNQDVIKTNSSHHQAVKAVGEEIKICARASDGVIEAIEHKNHPFCLGVQWHPEFDICDADKKLFSAFTQACEQYKKNK